MDWLLISIGVWLVGGIGALLVGSSPAWASRIGVASAVLGSLTGIVPVLSVLFGGPILDLSVAWNVPSGSLAMGMDVLSAFFLVPILILSGLAAIYGGEYLLSYRQSKTLGIPWFLYNWMIAGMVMVFLARNAVLFLVGWEVMTLCAAFLVTFDDEKASVRSAGWMYLVASHLATALLLILFILLGRESASSDFSGFAIGTHPSWLPSFLFLCAAVGFGTKAGIMPFHVWLPEAHPAAPSHVSAVMSGVLLKTGVYGLFRSLTFLGEYQEWWGWALMAIGLGSALMGILFASAQHDLKRFLAYSSVENIGIIFIGLGMGVVGTSKGSPVLATLGFCGALLHVLNHSMAKGMLFLNAGAVLHATGTRRFDLLGGLLKKMPWEGSLFLVGSAALCALPPMNGFLSEFWIYLGILRMKSELGSAGMLPSLVLLAGLALVGGLAAVSFSKAFGSTYLGQSRQSEDAPFHRSGWAMRFPMVVLTGVCLAMVPLLPWLAGFTAPVVQLLSGMATQDIRRQISLVQASLWPLSISAAVLIGLVGLLLPTRWVIMRNSKIGWESTWGCGYAEPSRRMQYTGTSYSQSLTDFFSTLLQSRKREERPSGLFPRFASIVTRVPDLSLEKVYRPFFGWVDKNVSKWRWIQHGRIQAYVLYVSVTLIFLLAWKLG